MAVACEGVVMLEAIEVEGGVVVRGPAWVEPVAGKFGLGSGLCAGAVCLSGDIERERGWKGF